MDENLDTIMESASQMLAQMDYLACEARCLEALHIARSQKNWSYYCRILLPLQEARRQRRMIAAEGAIRIGSASLEGDMPEWLETHQVGCFVLTAPHSTDMARQLEAFARVGRKFCNVLFAEVTPAEGDWTLRSHAGPEVVCDVPAPPAEMVDRWLVDDKKVSGTFSAADWFIDASESLGDAALATVNDSLTGEARVLALDRCLEVFNDHEILHQKLAAAARSLV